MGPVLPGATAGPWQGPCQRYGAPAVSTVLTFTAHRRRMPRRNRRMATISTGCFDGWLVDVSAVDTGLLAGLTPRGAQARLSPAPSALDDVGACASEAAEGEWAARLE